MAAINWIFCSPGAYQLRGIYLVDKDGTKINDMVSSSVKMGIPVYRNLIARSSYKYLLIEGRSVANQDGMKIIKIVNFPGEK